MKYGKVLVSHPENQKKTFCFFHVLGFIIPQNMFRAKKTSVCHAALPPPPLTKICHVDFSVALRDRELKFWIQLWFRLKFCMPFLEF
jgi:hypothetical protein